MATARKTSSSRSAAKKSPSGRSSDSARKSTSETSESNSAPAKKSSTPRKRGALKTETPRRKGAQQLAAEASRQLVELTGKSPEGICGLRRSEDGWVVQVEVLELRRIPNTTDVLATYEVEVDSDGDLLEYRRVHRYVRGVPGEDGR